MTMKERISIQELVAYNNTPKAKALVIQYGYSPAKNYNDLIYKLFRFTKEYKQEAIEELAKLHPHKDLILNFNKQNVEEKSSFMGMNYPNCCPCRMRQQMLNRDYFYGFDGENGLEKSFSVNNILPMIFVAGLVSIVALSLSKG